MTVLIRVDADPQIGSGHFMRMIALAQMLRDDGRDVHVATAARNELCDAYLADEGLPTHAMPGGAEAGADAAALTAAAARVGATWLVLDGAPFTEPYQRAVRVGGRRVMSVDDFGRGHFVSDVVINQNYGAERLAYSTAPYTARLLGSRYVMLRREFRTARRSERPASGGPLRLLVTLGGTSRPALLVRLLDAVLADPARGVHVTVVAGAFQSDDPELARCAQESGGRVTIVRHSRRMAELMRGADAAITAAGSTMWELCHMGVPFLALPLDVSHDAFLTGLAGDGICARLSLALTRAGAHAALADAVRAFLDDAALRAALARRAARVVDPVHARRELAALLDA
jgi:UDP-2,4-diacetamido-2,4,6-trideoxy-beta-L-altropyranose hydrolase